MKKKTAFSVAVGLAVVVALVGFGILTSEALEEKCPISGKPVNGTSSLNVNGKTIGFCCDNCPKAYAKKIRLQADAEGAKVCPISKNPAKETESVIHLASEKVAFCCGDCQKKYLEEKKLAIVDKGPAKCPVSGGDAKAEHKLVVNGEALYFCCDKCPQGYAKGLNISKKSAEATKCPISKEDVNPATAVIVTSAKKVYFCCEKCSAKYVEAEFKAPEADKKPEAPKEKRKEGDV